jgi:hypothetical protein
VVADDRVLGRVSGAGGVIEELTGAQLRSPILGTGTANAQTHLKGDGNWETYEREKSITVEDPTSSEDIAIFFTNKAITVTEIRAGVRGSTPSVTISVMHNTDRSAAGNQILDAATAITNTTTGQDLTITGDTTIPADSHVWLESSAQTGTVDELYVTIFFTED